MVNMGRRSTLPLNAFTKVGTRPAIANPMLIDNATPEARIAVGNRSLRKTGNEPKARHGQARHQHRDRGDRHQHALPVQMREPPST